MFVSDIARELSDSSLSEASRDRAPRTASGGSGAGVSASRPVADARAALRHLERVMYVARGPGGASLVDRIPWPKDLLGVVPALPARELGARSFREAHGLRFACTAGAMAGGIASVDLVAAMARAGMLGFFGAGGLPLPQVEEAVLELQRRLGHGESFGFNLLHNPYDAKAEMDVVQLYLRHGVRRVDAAAFMDLTPAIVLYRARGLRRRADGLIERPNHVFAKVSRPEVAERFLAPAPEALLRELVGAGLLTPQEAALASLIPVAEDLTAEADSGGHTDQRPLPVLLPMMQQQRAEAMERHGYAKQGIAIHIGAAGGIGEPTAAHAALALGADYLMTGSVNQSCREAGTSAAVRRMLAEADMADVMIAPAPDMFELGAKVQVLKRGTAYGLRAQKLYDLWRAYPSFEAMPQAEREKVELQILRRPFDEVWAETERYWQARDPREADRARSDGRLKMALCFRWYLGMSSRWARAGEEARRLDFQIWCGPSMGAFNRWVRGSWLEPVESREAPLVALALLQSAAAISRREFAARAGVERLPSLFEVGRPASREELMAIRQPPPDIAVLPRGSAGSRREH
jgi:trans-AT polyketide synthase/acyltransferase/oxidoreductase domain-containing protein